MDAVEPQLTTTDQVQHATRRSDHDLRSAFQRADLAVHAGSAVDRHGLDVAELTDARDLVGDLDAELTRWREHQRLHVGGSRVDLFDDGNAEGGGLARPGLGLADEVSARSQGRYGSRLYLGWRRVAHALEGAGNGHRHFDIAEPMRAGLGKGGRQEGLVDIRVRGRVVRGPRSPSWGLWRGWGWALRGALARTPGLATRPRRGGISLWQGVSDVWDGNGALVMGGRAHGARPRSYRRLRSANRTTADVEARSTRSGSQLERLATAPHLQPAQEGD